MTPARPELADHETSKSKGSGPHHGHRRIIAVPPIRWLPGAGSPMVWAGHGELGGGAGLGLLHAYKRLAIRWEYRADLHEGLVSAVGGHR